jgi:hypothetical protein
MLHCDCEVQLTVVVQVCRNQSHTIMGKRIVNWRFEAPVAHANQDRSLSLITIFWSENRDVQIKNAVTV